MMSSSNTQVCPDLHMEYFPSSGVLTVPVGTKPITVKLPNSSAALNQLVAQLGPGVKVIMPGKQANPDLRGKRLSSCVWVNVQT